VRRLGREQPVVFPLYDRVTFAGAFFEARALEHPNVAASVSAEAGFLELDHRFGHPFAPHAKHVRDEFLRLPPIRLRAMEPLSEKGTASVDVSASNSFNLC
jgi:hypothetical protein